MRARVFFVGRCLNDLFFCVFVLVGCLFFFCLLFSLFRCFVIWLVVVLVLVVLVVSSRRADLHNWINHQCLHNSCWIIKVFWECLRSCSRWLEILWFGWYGAVVISVIVLVLVDQTWFQVSWFMGQLA